jgi:osmotically-inducible protein OsmY
MKKNRPLLLVLALLAVVLQGCAEMSTMNFGLDRRSTGTLIDDEGIELRATNRVSERFGDKVHVNITSFNRSVLVTGEVPNEQAKAEIEKIITGTVNVRGVTNDLQVAGGTSLSSRASDATITGKVKARFLDANRFNTLLVKVVTEASVVYLMGIVTESEANEAVEVARTTGGVRKVVKVFEYCKPTDAICAPRGTSAKPEEKKKSGS